MISGVIITAGIISLAVNGLSTGVDFKGGWSYVIDVENASASSIKEALSTNLKGANTEVKTYGAANEYKNYNHLHD